MNERNCKVREAEGVVKEYLELNKCCTVCRHSFNDILNNLKAISGGEAAVEDLEQILNACSRVYNMCQCANGKTFAAKVELLLTENRSEFLLHIENRVCPAGECPKLVLAPCQAACPAGIDIPNYIALVGKGDYSQALELIKEDVPLPGSLGRICEHPCQKACRRALVDKPIAICALKRLAYDQANQKEAGQTAAATSLMSDPVYNEKVAVIGAGPAGLSAAYFLAKQGYKTTIFEAMPEPGGMLAYGIPPYRLPREVLRSEIEDIKKMGVEIKVNSAITSIEDVLSLKNKGYSAVFIGTGAWKGSVPLPGCEGVENVLDGVSFLKTVNSMLLADPCVKNDDVSGKRVIVVGGGNVAIDAARVSLRLGARDVKIIYRRTREEMPALAEEIVDAEKEGISFSFLVSPSNIIVDNGGRVSHIECLQNELSEPDASGRRKPVPVEDSQFKIKTDLVIFATGQKPELSFLSNKSDNKGVKTERNLITVNPDTLETSISGIFAGGDAVTGPASAIKAMAAGKQAAYAIHCHLRGRLYSSGLKYPVKRKNSTLLQIDAEQRASSSLINDHNLYLTGKTANFEEVMSCINEDDAMVEAGRCLRCDLCTACGTCMEICRNQVGAAAIQLGYTGAAETTETPATDFNLPSERCIGCGTCSVNCPTGAITVKDDAGCREMRMCGYLMSKLELATCRICGAAFATEKQLDFINQQYKSDLATSFNGKDICPECSRTNWSMQVYGQRL